MPLKKLSNILSMGSGWTKPISTAWLRLCLGIFFVALVPVAWAATPADQNFDGLGLGDQLSNSVTIGGITYTNNASFNIRIVNDGDIASGGDHALAYRSPGPNTSTEVSFKTSDGDEFKLNSFVVATGFGSTTITIKGYRDNSEQVSSSFNLAGIFVGTFDVSGNSSWENIDEVRITGPDLDLDIDDLDFSPKVLPAPTITSATYNVSSGALVVTGTNFTATSGATNDVVANKFTLTGEGGSTYTLTDTANAEIDSATSFTLALSATDRAGVNVITNKNDNSSTDGTSYNLAGAAGFIAASPAAADLTANAITVSNVPLPLISSATYNASTGVLTVAGTGFTKRAGANNDIVANKFTLFGEGANSYTLTDTSNVEITSNISFALTLSATDKEAYNLIANKNGGVSTDISTFYLEAADDWAAGADPAIDIEDSSGNNITVSNVAIPTITSATYNFSTGVLVVTGSGYLSRQGAANDVIANKFTVTGQGGATYTLTDTANVDVSSSTSFTMTLSATDRTGVNSLLNNNGTSAQDSTTYNLAAADDWAAGADAALNVADVAGNGITASNVVTLPGAPTIGTATAGDTQVSVTFSAPGSDGGSAITSYTATASPGGASASGASSPLTVTGLTNGVAYTFTVTATNGVGTGSPSSASNSVTPKAAQTITFANPGARDFDTTPTLTASSDSGLTVTFSSATTGVCTITSGGALTFVTAGVCMIDADQAGDGSYLAASTVSQSFSVNAVVPGAPTAASATAGDTQATVSFTAPASTGGAAITVYTVTSSPEGLTGTGATSPITVTGLTNSVAYTFTVTATNSAGTGSASAASNSVTPAAAQTITFNNPGPQSFNSPPTLTATASSGLTPVFSSSTTGVCTITSGGALTFVTAGTCTIDADEPGNGSYLAAPTVSQSFNVNAVVPGAPTAATATAGDTQASVSFTAPAFTGGAAITGYTVTSNPGGLTGTGAVSPITVTGLTNGVSYTFTVTATNSAGTGSASAASNAAVPRATQTITFANPGAQDFGTAPTLSATADSGLTPVFTSATTGVCTITSGGGLTFVATGTCTINANEAGNGTYLPAAQVSRSFTVNAVVPGAPTASTATAGNTQATVTFTPPVSNGGAAITGYTLTASPGGATTTGAGSPITMTGLTNGTSYTFTVSATNSVGTGAPSAASNAVTPSVPPNNLPVITQGAATSVAMSEDGAPTAFALTLTATDSDSDPLSWSVTGAAQHGSASVSGGSVSYTPIANYNGSDSFVVQVSDGKDTANITVNVTITPVNDAPLISGTPKTSLEQDQAYSFTPTATDVDVGDILTFSITNKPTWASFNTATGALTGTPTNADAGISGGILISVNDGTVTVSLPVFEIEVISTIDPLQPIVTAPSRLDINATGLFTPVTLRQLLGLSSSATQAEVDLVLKALASDGVSGNTCCTTTPQGLTNNTVLLAPGRHQIKWKATNAVGVSGEAMQVVDVKPLVSLSKSQIAVRGSNVTFSVILNGNSPTYPLEIPYVVDASSTATAAEHNLVSGVARFTQKGQFEVAVPVSLAQVTGLSDSQLVVTLGNGINKGVTNRHAIDIRTGNVAPVVSMSISQGGVNTSLVTPNGGPVTVSVTVKDPNKQDTHSFDWSATNGLADTDGNPVDASRTFDPSNLTGGHQLQVTVTDSAGAAVSTQSYFRIVASLPVLSNDTDTDNDGISDALEGTGDTDDNGIPDYLDNMPSPNILPQTGKTTNSYLIECDPGVRCGLGLFARGSASGGVQILNEEVGSLDNLVADPAFKPVGGIFDFAIRDLPALGQSVRVVVPQQAPIPAQASYRKFQKGRWVTFIENANNSLASAAGSAGYCPPPGAAEWTPGLTAGHLCVQLTIEDGGPNDDDGLVNSAVVDPGAVSEAKVVEPPVEPPKPPVQVNSKGGGAVPALWILLLGSLVILKRVKPARLLAIAVAVLSLNAQARDLENTYVRLDIFTVNSSHSEADFTGALEEAGHKFTLTRYDDSRTGFQLALGYQWSALTYTEVGYLDLGDVDVQLMLDGDTDLDAFARDFAKEYPITATGATLVQGVSHQLSSAITLSAEAGAFIWSSEIDLDNAVFALKDDDGVDPLLGVKIDLALNDAFSFGLSGRRIFFGGQDIDLYSLGSTFRF